MSDLKNVRFRQEQMKTDTFQITHFRLKVF